MNDCVLEVAIPIPKRTLFDYLPPANTTIQPAPGLRVLVPFGRRKIVGVVLSVKKESAHPIEKLKAIDTYLDEMPLFSNTILSLIEWASRYYQTPLGEVFEMALPKKLREIPKETPLKTRKTKTALIIPKENKKESFNENNLWALNSAQENAINRIEKSFDTFKTFLLEGVTGSGKTEVYMQLIDKVLKKNQQALVLVPEIGLTPQLLARFEKRFSCPIAVLNSTLTDKKRLAAFYAARTGEAAIIIGTRLAAFVPLKNPGIFIIDEEHDPSFKQQEGFRYHARDLLIYRASLEKCPIILGTATPSLEALHNVNTERFELLQLPYRAGKGTLPTVTVLDIRHKKCTEGLSGELIKAMHEHIKQNGQILLFLNKRGYAPVLMCFQCDWISHCKQCDAKMTVHQQKNNLQCHHCDLTLPLLKTCPNCQATDLKPVGLGTERLEMALAKEFENATIIRVDRDTTRGKESFEEAMKMVYNGTADILIGTQMIAKGHHFPNVTLVGIIDIDQALFSTDFRSLEKMGQLITQVAGRTGRENRQGHVLLQTAHPKHPLLNLLLEKGYHTFANNLLLERKMTALPPYSHQTLIRAKANTLLKALQFLDAIKKMALPLKHADVQLLGPTTAPMERRHNQYHTQLLFQAPTRALLQQLLQRLIPRIESTLATHPVRWSVDVDPIDLY